MAQTGNTRTNHGNFSQFDGWSFTTTKGSDSLTDNQTANALSWMIQQYNTNGTIPTQAEFDKQMGQNSSAGGNEYQYILSILDENKERTGFDPYTGESLNIDYNSNAFNDYYNDAYGYDVEGTNANKQYNQMIANAQSTAQQDQLLADATAQQAAMQQASTVKSIVDQMRSERRAMLQSGYSQYDIANSEMSSLMNNINTLNNNANTMNQARLQAQYNYNNAQATAYDQWLQQANTQATAGSAYAAADAGDVVTTAKRLKQNSGLGSYVKQAQGSSSSTS